MNQQNEGLEQDDRQLSELTCEEELRIEKREFMLADLADILVELDVQAK